jgi:hypothetical protein
MTALNLAVVFAPTIMRPATLEREMTDMHAQRVTVQALVEHGKEIFDVPSNAGSGAVAPPTSSGSATVSIPNVNVAA